MDPRLACDGLRVKIGDTATAVRSIAEECKTGEFVKIAGTKPPDRGEMVANLMLSFRHLEDARMRIGKALQAYEGGVSRFDQPVGSRT